MIYAEASYFDGNHCQHVVAYEDDKRVKRRQAIARDMHRRSPERRTGSRARG